MLRRPLVLLIPVAVLLPVSLVLVQAQTTTNQQIGRGNFSLPIIGRNGLTGKNLTLSDFLGKVIVLEFMGPWCPPCQLTVPVMEKLYNQFAAQGVVFIAIAEPQNPHYPNVTMTQFLGNHTTSLTYVLDESRQTATMYNIEGVPMLFILSKAGLVVASYYGFHGIADVETTIAGIITAQLAKPVLEFDYLWLIVIISLSMIPLLRPRKTTTS